MTRRPPLLLGHRGARRSAPENTLRAFDLALAHGCDGFEFDVRCTADQRAIVSHDPRLRGAWVARNEYSGIVEKSRTRDAATGSRDCDIVPCLEDVITRYAGRAYLDIELKVAGLEERVVALVKSLLAETFVVSSFLPELLRSIHRLDRAIPLGFICDRKSTLAKWRQVPCAVVIPERKLVTKMLVDEVHSAGKKIFAWTVNDREEVLRLTTAGMDGIISDDTEMLCDTITNARGGSLR